MAVTHRKVVVSVTGLDNGDVPAWNSTTKEWDPVAPAAAATPPTGTGFARVTSGAYDAASSAVNLAGGATHITGTLPVANGGTGVTSLGTSPRLLYNDSGAIGDTPNVTYAGGGLVVNASGFVSFGTDPAATGQVRLPNASSVVSNNFLNNLDIPMMGVDTSDILWLRNSGSASTQIRFTAGIQFRAVGGAGSDLKHYVDTNGTHEFLVNGATKAVIAGSAISLNAPMIGLAAGNSPHALSGRASLDMADTNQVAAASLYSRFMIKLTGTLTETRTLTFPHPASEDESYTKLIEHAADPGQNITIRTGTGTTEDIGYTNISLFQFTPSGVGVVT